MTRDEINLKSSVAELRQQVNRQNAILLELISHMELLSQADWSQNVMTFSPELSNCLSDLKSKL